MKGPKIKILTVLLLISIIMIGCTEENLNNENPKENKEEEKDYTPEYGGEITIPISPINTINPLLNKSESLYDFYTLVYEGLFEFTEDHNIENELVESYEIQNEGRTIKIKLKENVQWHDGENFTTRDVKFTIDLLKYAARNSLYRSILDQYYSSITPENIEHIFNISVDDEYNLTINFDRSYSNALESLTFPIFPQHQFAGDNGGNSYDKLLSSDENFTPIGTGPYKFVAYEKSKHIKLEANEQWWREKPYIETVTGKFLEEDVQLTSFNSRSIDLANVSNKDWGKYADNENTQIYEYQTNNYEFLGFNFRNEIFNSDSGKELRKAIAYGINTKEIIKKVYMDNATETKLPILYESWLVDKEIDQYSYNVDRAKEILEKAGFSDSDKDGILESPEGDELEFKLLTDSYNSLRTNTANMIIKDLKEIGISISADYSSGDESKVTQEEIDENWENVIEKTRKGKFDIVLLGWKLSEIPDLAFAFHSEKIDDGSNFIGYNNPKVDQLLREIFNSKSRELKRDKYSQLQEVLLEDLPYVGLFFRDNALLIDNRIKGDITPKAYNLYNDIYKWFIPEELRHKPSEEKNDIE